MYCNSMTISAMLTSSSTYVRLLLLPADMNLTVKATGLDTPLLIQGGLILQGEVRLFVSDNPN